MRRVRWSGFIASLAGLVVAVVATAGAAAQEPGHPADVRISLRESAAAGGFAVVLHWSAVADPTADYEVWKRTAPDLSFQETEKYATVKAAERLPDGSYEFVDNQPGQPNRPCYMVGATTGSPPQSFTPTVCTPTLPAGMSALSVSSLPGPEPGSVYLSATGFAPGVEVVFEEATCGTPPCAEAARQTAQAGSSGPAVVLFKASRPDALVVAYETGWLASQLAATPRTPTRALPGGAGFGYPRGTRSGVEAIDRVLDAIESGDGQGLLALVRPRTIQTNGGSTVSGNYAWQCGEFGSTNPGQLLEFTGPGTQLWAAYRVVQGAPSAWKLFAGAEYALVVSYPGFNQPGAGLITVNADGIVGWGWSCQSLPPFFLRSAGGFVVSPWIEAASPGPPGTGNTSGWKTERPGMASVVVLGLALLIVAGLCGVRSRGSRD